MSKHSLADRITALAPVPEHLDRKWANETLARILADEPPARSRRLAGHRTAAIAVAGVLTLSTGAAVAAAVADPIDSIKETLLGFAAAPNTTGNGVGTIHDPQLVAQFERATGDVFALWISTTSTGDVCYAYSDAAWDGVGAPPTSELEYGCAGDVIVAADPERVVPLERPDQLGGFFKDTDEPILYGVSPYADAVRVRVEGDGVRRTLPLRADSHGFGTALPEAADADSLTLTFLDAAGRALGSTTFVAPVG
jgi:hypothetical protein